MPHIVLNKGQIQIGENIAVLVIFFILIAISLVVYVAFKQGDVRGTRTTLLDREAVDIALTTSVLPELKCTARGSDEGNCVDLLKAQSLSTLIATQPEFFLFYQNIFAGEAVAQGSLILLHEIYPRMSDVIIYNNTPNMTRREIPIYFPVVVRNVSMNRLERDAFGVLEVRVYG